MDKVSPNIKLHYIVVLSKIDSQFSGSKQKLFHNLNSGLEVESTLVSFFDYPRPIFDLLAFISILNFKLCLLGILKYRQIISAKRLPSGNIKIGKLLAWRLFAGEFNRKFDKLIIFKKP